MNDLNLQAIYRRRFSPEIGFRSAMWRVLCRDFFSDYVPKDATVLDVAAGYGEFINHIDASGKIALDLNPDIEKHLAEGVRLVQAPSTDMSGISDASCDVAFVSNFLEHISKEDIVRTLREIHRVLKKGGRLLVLQPNIRLCKEDYWSFFDHITPLDEKSLAEALETNGFEVVECRTRFLPYTLKSRLPKSILLLRIYLRIPLLHYLFGKQTFIYARKT